MCAQGVDQSGQFLYKAVILVLVSLQPEPVYPPRAFALEVSMPNAAPRPCRQAGCGALVRGASRCPAHAVAAGSFADRTRGSRHDRGYGTNWDKLRATIVARDCGLCQQCQRNGVVNPVGDKPYSAYVDHITPKAEGGTDAESNLETLCRACHTAKTDQEKNRLRRGGAKS